MSTSSRPSDPPAGVRAERADAPSERVALRRATYKGAYDRPTIDAILDATPYCHLGYVLPDGQPVVVPTLHVRMGDHLVLHASQGSRLGLAAPGGWRVCVTVTIVDGLVLARSGFNHSVNHRSVVVLGEAEPVTDDAEKLAALEALTDHVVPGRWAELRPPTPRELAATTVVRVRLDEVSAKVRTGPPVDEPEDHAGDTWAGVVPVRLVHGDPVASPDLRAGIEPSPAVVALTERA
jgi:uncharacterized protein